MKHKFVFRIFLLAVCLGMVWQIPEQIKAAECARFDSLSDLEFLADNGDDPTSENCYGYKGYQYYEYGISGIKYIVAASRGAIVTCQVGKKKPVELIPDDSDENGDTDYYYFEMPLTESSHTITAKLGKDETVLSIKADYKKETAKAPKPKYSVEEGFDYGRIVASGMYEIDFGSVWYHNAETGIDCDNYFKDQSMQCGKDDLETYFMLLEGNSDEVKNAWKWTMSHFVKNGGTLTVKPAYEELQRYYNDENRLIESTLIASVYEGVYGKATGISFQKETNAWGDICYEPVYGKDITVSWLDVKVKEAKVRIPAQKAAPTVKVDAVKGTLTTKSNQEISVRSNAKEGEAYSEWTTAGAKMKLSDITCNNGILSGASIRIRTKATGKTIASRYTTIEIPVQTQLKPDGFTMTGTTTNAAIKIADFDKAKNPYEYTTSAPSDSTKWTPVKNGEIKFTAKKPFQGIIYIRQKGVNENTKKGLDLKLPSSYVTVKLDGATLKWSIE